MVYLFKTFAAYADFNGRARRAEYWQWTLFMLAVNFGFSGLMRILPEIYRSPVNWVSWIWAAGTLVPGIAVTVRRFHDSNRTGWWTLYLMTVPILLFYCGIALSFFSAKFLPGKEINFPKHYIWITGLAALGLFSYIPPLIFLLQDSSRRSNRFGVDPKERDNEVAVF